MRRGTKWLLLGGSAGLAAAAGTAYGLIARPWHLRWGATRDEVSRSMPFDKLIGNPNYFATRAITIDAPPERVWPYLIDTRELPKGTLVRHVDENRSIVFAPPEQEAEATWVVVLEPLADGRTRLISRNRARFGRRVTSVLRYLLVDPGQFVIERGWLAGLKRRVEAGEKPVKADADVPPPAAQPVVPERIEEPAGSPD
jgi:hypothetical protein